MDRLGDITMKRALILLGVFIVVGGILLSVLSVLTFGLFGSFASSGYGPAYPASVNGAPLGYANNAPLSGLSTGTNPAGDSTQIIKSTTIVSTTTASRGNSPQATGTGFGTQANGTSLGTGSLLEFTSDLTIQSTTPQTTASGIVALAYSVGGYVAYQATYRDSAFVVIRVPSSQFRQVLGQVEALGTVQSLVSNSNDVRVQYTDLNATLASLKTEQGALLRLLNQSSTINSTLAIENQLQGVNQQINNIQSQILQTRTLIDFATINVTVTQGASNAQLSLVLRAAPQNGTAPFSVTFNAIVKGGVAPYIVNFNFADGTADQGQILIHTFYQPGDFKVTVTATDQNGTAAIQTAKVHVDAAPGQIGTQNFLGTVVNLFVSVVEGIVEVAVVVLPIAAVGAIIIIPFRRRAKTQKDFKQGP
ncbi:MAG: DUF4349 domain-containing protein [Thaumarchaeota archaeon]|nr:DUF4349 domain-containing protein [Nitrososphaerota archaeon]